MLELISLLTENEKVLAELSFALKEEQSCIVNPDLVRLVENCGRKEEITGRLLKVRDKCRELMLQAGGELDLKEAPSLSVLVAISAADEQIVLRPLQRRLERLARALERQHIMNRKLLENSIGMIKNSMALFTSLLGGCDTYGAKGQINCGRSSGSILRQEI
jgi:flagellar biosynthesis/type III secretory pathway chaperone